MTDPQEMIARLPEMTVAPAGYEIARVLETHAEPTGAGTNYRLVFTVALRRVSGASQAASPGDTPT